MRETERLEGAENKISKITPAKRIRRAGFAFEI